MMLYVMIFKRIEGELKELEQTLMKHTGQESKEIRDRIKTIEVELKHIAKLCDKNTSK